MAGVRKGLAVLVILIGVLVWAGCSAVAGDTVSDSQLISALNLKKASTGYQMHGSPFCQIDDLLNNVDEVNSANDKKKGGVDFVIAAPNGEAGVVAHPPFAPSCKREAKAALKKIARQSKNSG
jgi:hypothetical protein